MHFQRPQGGCEGFIQTGAFYQFIGALQQPSRQRRVKLKPLKNLRPSGPSTLKPQRGLSVRRRTSPAQRCYITPEGGSPQPACKAKPITGRTLGAQGRRPGGAINPRGEAASTFGNTGKHRLSPDPDRAIRRLSIISFYAAADR